MGCGHRAGHSVRNDHHLSVVGEVAAPQCEIDSKGLGAPVLVLSSDETLAHPADSPMRLTCKALGGVKDSPSK